MFNNLNDHSSSGATNNAVDDIFAETDKAAHTNQGSANIETQSAGLSASPGVVLEEAAGGGRRGAKLKFILILVLAVVILAAAAYLVYTKFKSSSADQNLVVPSEPIVTNTPEAPLSPITPSEPVVSDNIVMPEPETPAVVATETPIAVVPVDSDADSLTDSEEQILGTNINLIDSDFDGLSDYEELKIYLTNPLNVDSDGDSFKDGDEIKSGYNPNGAGKL